MTESRNERQTDGKGRFELCKELVLARDLAWKDRRAALQHQSVK